MIWEDAKFETEFDGPPEKAPSTIFLHDCGWLVRQNRKEVVLAMDLDPDAKEVRFTFAIPRKMVHEIIELGPKNVKNDQESPTPTS